MQQRLRADAQRSRDAVVAAFSALALERGADVPLYEVAKRAGVGQGTLYRHFPTRTALLAAVFEEEIEALERTAAERPDDPALLLVLLETAVRSQARLHGLSAVLIAAEDAGGELQRLTRRSSRLLERPLAAAIAAGVVRDDLVVADVVAVMSMMEGMLIGLVAVEDREAAVARGLRLVLPGLRPPSS